MAVPTKTRHCDCPAYRVGTKRGHAAAVDDAAEAGEPRASSDEAPPAIAATG